jgi:hypothetical protein
MHRNTPGIERLLGILQSLQSAAIANGSAQVVVPLSEELREALPALMRLQEEVQWLIEKPHRLLELFPDLNDCDLQAIARNVH